MEMPLVCNLEAIPADKRAQHEQLASSIVGQIQATRELSNGFAFKFSRDLWVDIAQWSALESLCCPFINFQMELRTNGFVWMTLTGPTGMKDMLRPIIDTNVS